MQLHYPAFLAGMQVPRFSPECKATARRGRRSAYRHCERRARCCTTSPLKKVRSSSAPAEGRARVGRGREEDSTPAPGWSRHKGSRRTRRAVLEGSKEGAQPATQPRKDSGWLDPERKNTGSPCLTAAEPVTATSPILPPGLQSHAAGSFASSPSRRLRSRRPHGRGAPLRACRCESAHVRLLRAGHPTAHLEAARLDPAAAAQRRAHRALLP